MTVENQDYKLKILEHAVNQCIDNLLPNSSEDALSVMIDKSDEIAWKIVTEIYTKSGHQIDFLFIRDILNLKIKALQNKIAEEEVIRAKLEAQKLAREIKQERIEKEKERIKAQLEVERLAKIADQKARIEKDRKQKQQKKLHEFKKEHPNLHINSYEKLEIFLIIRDIIIDIIVGQLAVDKKQVTLDADIKHDLGAYELLDNLEIIMAIEKKLNIKMLEGEYKNLLCWNVGQLVCFVMQKID